MPRAVHRAGWSAQILWWRHSAMTPVGTIGSSAAVSPRQPILPVSPVATIGWAKVDPRTKIDWGTVVRRWTIIAWCANARIGRWRLVHIEVNLAWNSVLGPEQMAGPEGGSLYELIGLQGKGLN